MTGTHSIWAYPWDLYDLGVETALNRVTDVGLNMVSLATSYHSGRFLQPGNPRRRVYFPQDGTVYYKTDPARWAEHEIVPLQADIVDSEGDMLGTLIRRRDAGGPSVSCWTVCLHNTRLGMLHPSHVMRTAHGDAHSYALCPSSPVARAYVTGLTAEISHIYHPDRIELESPDFMGFSHGFHHEKDGLGLLPEDVFLLGVCFCDHCLKRAASSRIPAEAARLEVANLLDSAFAREVPRPQFPDFKTLGVEAFNSQPALAAYLAWRSEPVTSLISEIRDATHPSTALLLIDAEGTWAGGVDLAAVVPHVDGILLCAYSTDTAQIESLMAQTRATLGPDKTLITGFQLFYPNVSDRQYLCERIKAASGHADGFNFYNLGLVPDARLDWIKSALLA